jgi:hypothetical protein
VAGVTAQDWTDVSVKNPFSFDRNDIAIVAPTQAVAATPKPVLFGIMAVGADKIALVSPGRSGRASRPIKTGESVDDNWKVVEIKEKSVIVVGGTGTREEIIMNDPTAQVARSIDRTGTGAPAGGNVLTATPSAASAPTNTNSASSAPPAAAQPPAPAQPEDILLTPFGPVKRTKP